MTIKLSQDQLDTLPRVDMGRRQLLRGLAAGTVIPLGLSGCASGGFAEALVSDQQILQASSMAWQEALSEQPVSRDPALRRRVERVGQRIVPASGLTQYEWEFVVFDSDTQNAWVLPGGKVAFYRGILETMANDDQLATVMGHEVGHLARNHAAERARRQATAGVGLGIANIALGGAGVENPEAWSRILGTGVVYGVILPYSREHELEADRLGIDYMERAGYDPIEALRFWTNKAQAAAQAGQSGPPEFSSTHPSDRTRIAQLVEILRNKGYQVG
ncbi:MAG: M48 family metallopeptidase [Oceanicaulis sp.]